MAVLNHSGHKADKLIRDALMVAVNRRDKDGGKRLMKAAEACVDAAIAGDIRAFSEIADRIDGRPAQDMTIKADATGEFLEALRAIAAIRRALPVPTNDVEVIDLKAENG